MTRRQQMITCFSVEVLVVDDYALAHVGEVETVSEAVGVGLGVRVHLARRRQRQPRPVRQNTTIQMSNQAWPAAVFPSTNASKVPKLQTKAKMHHLGSGNINVIA